jgi:hypothetical protein
MAVDGYGVTQEVFAINGAAEPNRRAYSGLGSEFDGFGVEAHR